MQNTLFTHDNLFVLHGMNSEIADLIYLDPPFNSKRTYSAPIGTRAAGASFKDMWSWEDINEAYLEKLAENYPSLAQFIESTGSTHSKAMMSYLLYMAQRIIELHRILKPTGSFYLHCDPTASHYLKLLLDNIFNKKNFITEIIWSYSWGVRSTKRWNKKHDVILMYTKTENYTFNALDVMEKRQPEVLRRLASGVESATMAADKSASDDKTLALPTDVWSIPTINAMSKERTGYPTQKPLALLNRIIKASSNVGDLVLDPFCGCATTCVAAQQLQRKWVGIDIEEKAVDILMERLQEDSKMFQYSTEQFINLRKPLQRTDIQLIPITKETKNDIKKQLFKKQEGHCNGCNLEFQIQNCEIDHVISKAKGGGDYMENYQLLCGSCNRIKGARPMEYLRMKIQVRLSLMKNKVIFGE